VIGAPRVVRLGQPREGCGVGRAVARAPSNFRQLGGDGRGRTSRTWSGAAQRGQARIRRGWDGLAVHSPLRQGAVGLSGRCHGRSFWRSGRTLSRRLAGQPARDGYARQLAPMSCNRTALASRRSSICRATKPLAPCLSTEKWRGIMNRQNDVVFCGFAETLALVYQSGSIV
jgi:hypothetical protein